MSPELKTKLDVQRAKGVIDSYTKQGHEVYGVTLAGETTIDDLNESLVGDVTAEEADRDAFDAVVHRDTGDDGREIAGIVRTW